MRDINHAWNIVNSSPVNRIRNICVLGHVDHGKTTVCDQLISTNGYISRRSAGTCRYMDAREDEQKRLITMKASAIALVYENVEETWLINLIDSPGHVDFTTEIFAATRLADCALIVIDVLEGFLSQTRSGLEQALREGLEIVILLNQIDRLIVESRLTPSGVYDHVRGVLENLNLAFHQLICAMVMSRNPDASDEDLAEEADKIFESRSFSPVKDNVIFCSALHGWAFTIGERVNSVFTKLMNRAPSAEEFEEFRTYLWDEYVWNQKLQCVKRLQSKKQPTLAAQIIMGPLCEIYGLCEDISSLGEAAREQKLKKILDFTKVELPAIDYEDIGTWSNYKLSRMILSLWLPCADTIMKTLVKSHSIIDSRLTYLLGDAPNSDCLPISSNTVVFHVTKFVGADISMLRMTADRLHGGEKLSDLVAFGRVFNGELRLGDKLYVSSSSSCDDEVEFIVNQICIPMGLDLIPEQLATNGAIITVQLQSRHEGGLEKTLEDTCKWLLTANSTTTHDHLLVGSGFNPVDRAVTFTNIKGFPQLRPLYLSTTPIIRVSAAPQNLTEWPEFIRALALLYRADPAIRIDVSENSGEFLIYCCGEVHLEKTIQDLNSLYLRDNIKIHVSEPLPMIRETINDASVGGPNQINSNKPFPPWKSNTSAPTEGSVRVSTSDNSIQLVVSATHTPENVLEWIDLHVTQVENSFQLNKPVTASTCHLNPKVLQMPYNTIPEPLKSKLLISQQLKCLWGAEMTRETNAVFKSHDDSSKDDPGILSVCVNGDSRAILCATSNALEKLTQLSTSHLDVNDCLQLQILKCASLQLVSAIISGFRLASSCGPVCGEPLRGVTFILEDVTLMQPDLIKKSEDDVSEGSGSRPATCSTYGPLSGQLIRAMKVASQQSMLQIGRIRIFEYLLSLEILCDQEVLGPVYSILYQRRTKIISEKPLEGTSNFVITGSIPSTEVCGIASDLRKRSSGKCTINIGKGKWSLNSEDPFIDALLTEDGEEFDDSILSSNIPRTLINNIRKRKGLAIETKLVESSEKQRTLSKNK